MLMIASDSGHTKDQLIEKDEEEGEVGGFNSQQQQ